uniref:Uncharacterized protein n=1 Tax=Vespula pensylvanica TaxID=30213 RepID=A0A834NIV1_VESPE|nr:hypothetical protein H0235_013252 [Vespula pensylvanica]
MFYPSYAPIQTVAYIIDDIVVIGAAKADDSQAFHCHFNLHTGNILPSNLHPHYIDTVAVVVRPGGSAGDSRKDAGLVLPKGRVVGDGVVGWIGEGEDAHFPRIFALFIHLPLPTEGET